MWTRELTPRLRDDLLKTKKIMVLYGPRRSGKTTVLQSLAKEVGGRVRFINGDFLDDRRLLRPERAALAALAEGTEYLFVDEAQNIDEIGLCLKLLHDVYPAVRVVATGSSSFGLAAQTGEPLTGRQIHRVLYPLAFAEYAQDPVDASRRLEEALVFGSYPEVVSCVGTREKVELLRQLAADYLLKDVFARIDGNRSKLDTILRLLAFQTGSEVSFSEIGRAAQLDVKTVSRYVAALEDAYVIVRIGAFSRNLRKEISKGQKVFFVDLGMRNAVLGAFEPLDARADVGALFENFMVIERRKQFENACQPVAHHFWRTYDQQEIDLIEVLPTTATETERLRAFEFKWSDHAKARVPQVFRDNYPAASVEVLRRSDAYSWLTAR
jgi:uncharacterized protein